MKEIKYRGWHLGDRCMIDWLTVCQSAFNMQCIAEQKRASSVFVPLMYSFFTNSTLVLMQCTGVEDRGGREIYEGDIVELPAAASARRGVVVWNDEKCCFSLWFPNLGQYNPECFQLGKDSKRLGWAVIGSVHENPGAIPKVLKRWRKLFMEWVPGVVLPD